MHELIQCPLKLVGLLINIYPLVGILDRLTSLLLVILVPRMIPPALALCEIPPLIESQRSSLVVALESVAVSELPCSSPPYKNLLGLLISLVHVLHRRCGIPLFA